MQSKTKAAALAAAMKMDLIYLIVLVPRQKPLGLLLGWQQHWRLFK
jgi:hypothetical protein